MHVQRLTLLDFRNFSQEAVTLQPKINFLFGDNAQGKTNFLEAVYLLTHGRSFRPVESDSFVRRANGAESSSRAPKTGRIRGWIRKNHLDFNVEISFEANRKSIRINDKAAQAADLVRLFPCVLFSPESLSAIKEGPEFRRLLADELILIERPDQSKLLAEYSKCLRQRNRLLKTIAASVQPRKEDLLTLDSLNQIYLLLATHLTKARISALLQIRDDFSSALQMIDQTATSDVGFDYLISDQAAMTWSEEQIFNALQKRQLELAKQECALGQSLVGPQKHDIKFLFAWKDSRFYCSQGQQRALILAFKIAQIVYHNRVHQTLPVLLLDDVLSELDLKKRVCLMKFLEDVSAQVLITATELTWSDHLAPEIHSVFNVRDGSISLRTKTEI